VGIYNPFEVIKRRNSQMQYSQKIRNPVLVLILSIVTCGIYELVIIYQISDEVRQYTGDQSISPGLELLLTIITCNLYLIYWCYKYSKHIYDMQLRAGVNMPNDVSTVALILPIFGLSVVSLLLMQSELNRVWEKLSAM